jgi:hypothetical protein
VMENCAALIGLVLTNVQHFVTAVASSCCWWSDRCT